MTKESRPLRSDPRRRQSSTARPPIDHARRRASEARRSARLGAGGAAVAIALAILVIMRQRPAAPVAMSEQARRALGEAETLLDQGRADEAIALARQQLEREPDAGGLRYALGSALAVAGDHRGAADQLREEIRRDPSHLDSYPRLAASLEELGERDEARRTLERLLERDPGNTRGTLMLAQSLQAAGETERAEELLRAGAERIGAEAWVKLGAIYSERGELTQAEEVLRRALEADPDDTEAIFLLGRTLIRLGNEAEGQRFLGRHAEIERRQDRLELLRHYTRESTSDAEDFTNLGSYQLLHHDLEGAVASFQAALDRDAGQAEAMVGMGRAMLELERNDEAAQWLVRATERSPDEAEAFFFLGLALHLQGDFAAAQKALGRSRELDPWTSTEYLFLGNVLATSGALADAEIAYRKSLDLGPEIPEAHYKLALVSCARDRPAAARAPLERFVELEPLDPRGSLLLGLVLHRTGDLAGAQERFRRALARYAVTLPNSGALDGVLAGLRSLPGAPEALEVLEAIRRDRDQTAARGIREDTQ